MLDESKYLYFLGRAVAQASSFGFGVRRVSEVRPVCLRIYKWKLRQPEQSHVTAVAVKKVYLYTDKH